MHLRKICADETQLRDAKLSTPGPIKNFIIAFCSTLLFEWTHCASPHHEAVVAFGVEHCFSREAISVLWRSFCLSLIWATFCLRQQGKESTRDCKRQVWCLLAVLSIVVTYSCYKNTQFHNNHVEGCSKEHRFRGFLLTFTEGAALWCYIRFIVWLSWRGELKPLKMTPIRKLIFYSIYVFIHLITSNHLTDPISHALCLSLIFHTIPMAQLCFALENYGVLDSLLSPCVGAALYLRNYPEYVWWVVMLMSFGMQFVKYILSRKQPSKNGNKRSRGEDGEKKSNERLEGEDAEKESKILSKRQQQKEDDAEPLVAAMIGKHR